MPFIFRSLCPSINSSRHPGCVGSTDKKAVKLSGCWDA